MFPELAVEPVLCQELPGGGEQLEAVVPGVGDQDLVQRVAGHVPRVVELPRVRALLTELHDVRALTMEVLTTKAKALERKVSFQIFFLWSRL